jgi:acyl-CoA hydrolase
MLPLARELTSPDEVLDLVPPRADVIVPLANGEPVALLDALDAHAERLDGVRVHQMHALHDRPYLHGQRGENLRHISYFLSPVTRPAFLAGGCDLVPCHFSEVPVLLHARALQPIVLAASSLPDQHGYVSLGTNADYVAGLIGRVPFVLEANAQMPRTFGRNQLHLSQVQAIHTVNRPLVAIEPAAPTDLDVRIASLVAERIGDRATIQAGIGSIPNAVVGLLRDRRDLGVHTELLSDGVMDLVLEGVVTGVHKVRRPTKVVTTFALGSQRLYDFLHENAAVELLPVEWVNDPRVIAQHRDFVSINATTEIDLLGQCASETVAGRFWSGSGGQADFARGAMYSEGGQGFIVLPSTARGGTVSRIVPRLTPGSAVTTLKNTVDKVVTEHGVADLRGRTIRERARALIAVAEPAFRDRLRADAAELGYL